MKISIPWAFVAPVAFAASTHVFAQAGSTPNAEALRDIRETAAAICQQVPLTGSSSSVELSGQGKAELTGLLKRLGTAGVAGSAKYANNEYENVLQKDLATIVGKGQDCRLRVFEKLSDMLLVSNKPKSRAQLDAEIESNFEYEVACGSGYAPGPYRPNPSRSADWSCSNGGTYYNASPTCASDRPGSRIWKVHNGKLGSPTPCPTKQ